MAAKEYVKNHIRHKKLSKGHLITNDYGSWAHLTDEEYAQFTADNMPQSLQESLASKGILLSEENVEQVIEEYRRKNSFLFQGASLHIVVPTLRCNLRCIYCHAKAQPLAAQGYDMDMATAKKSIDFIFQTPSVPISIEFQGGEPLLRFDLVKYMVEYIKEKNKTHKKNVHISIVTNLNYMTDEIFEFFKSHGVGICTSLDGPENVHNANRANHGKTHNWIKKIVESYTVNAMLLVTEHSVGFHKEIVDEYLGLGLDKIWIKPVNKLAYAVENWRKVGISPEQYLDFYKKALDYIVKTNKKQSLVENYTKILLRKILTKDCVNFTDLESPCGAVIGQLALNYDGNVYTCDEGRQFDIFKLGSIDQPYRELVTSREACAIVHASINDNSYCDICAFKPYCGLCPVCSYSETGNVLSKLPDRRCQILMGMFEHIFEKLMFDKEYTDVFHSWVKN